MKQYDLGTVSQEGVGKPDYSRKIASAIQRAGIYLEYNQNLVMFGVCFTDQVVHPSPLPWVKPPLSPGASLHAINVATGMSMPYTVSAGYTVTLIEKEMRANQDFEVWGSYDGMVCGCFGMEEAGSTVYTNRILPFTTKVIDPTAASSHTIDTLIINVGSADLEGGFDFIGLLESVGTEPITTKDCMCPFCSHIQTEPVTATKITCENCHQIYIVYDMSRIRRI
jgi:hypothetical protein